MILARPLQPSYFKPRTRAFAGGRKTTAKLAAESSGPHPAHSKQISAATAPDPTGNPHRRQRGQDGPRSRVRQGLQTNSAEHSSGRWSRQPRQTAGRKKSRSSAASTWQFKRGCAQPEWLPRPASSRRSPGRCANEAGNQSSAPPRRRPRGGLPHRPDGGRDQVGDAVPAGPGRLRPGGGTPLHKSTQTKSYGRQGARYPITARSTPARAASTA